MHAKTHTRTRTQAQTHTMTHTHDLSQMKAHTMTHIQEYTRRYTKTAKIIIELMIPKITQFTYTIYLITVYLHHTYTQ